MRARKLAMFLTLLILVGILFSAASVIAERKVIDLDGHACRLDSSKSIPNQLNYQGFLTNAADSSAVTAALEMTFRLFDSETKGTELWAETHPAVEVNDGLFQVLLGSMTSFPAGLFDGSELWLQTEVESEVLVPRKYLGSVAYGLRAEIADQALLANDADQLEGQTVTDLDDRWVSQEDLDHLDATDGDPANAIYVDDAGKVGVGTTSPLTELDVNGSVNAATYYGDGSNLTGISGAADDDWTVAGNHMYSAVSGSVGVGTSSPENKLHVAGDVNATTYYGDGSHLTGISGTTDNDWTISGNDVYHETGNVGIGTSSPSARLDVNGTVNTDSLYKIGGSSVLSAPGTQNIFAGIDAGANNTGSYGAFIGYQAGKNNLGNDNVFIGCAAGSDNTEGDYNTFVGRAAGVHNIEASSNTFVGSYAGFDNTTGEYNTFVGNNAGRNNTAAQSNTFIGMSAGHDNETGNSNTFLGTAAGIYNTAGNYNTFTGSDAGYSNETGDENIFAGYKAGHSNTVGNDNTFLGTYSGYSNDLGDENTFVGGYAGYHNIGAGSNTFVGFYTGFANTTGQFNTFLGKYAGRHNTTAQSNTFVGMSAGHDNETGSSNTFLGTVAGIHNTEGSDNTFVGSDAGYSNETGDENTFVGYKAGHENTTGQGNVFLGYQAGYNETGSDKLYIANGSGASDALIYGDFSTGEVGIGTTSPSAKFDVDGDVNTDSLYKIGGTAVLSTEGSQNVFVGAHAGGNNTGGYATFVGSYAGFNNQGGDNVFVGRSVGVSNTTGGSNTFLGQAAGYSNTEGSSNTFLGSATGYKNTTGDYNTCLGRHAGYSNITGSNNVFVGYRAGYYETGSNKLYIANDKDASDVLIYGDFLTDKVGIGTVSPGYRLQVGESGDGTEARANAWNTFSSRECKKDITALQPSDYERVLKRLGELDVVQYHYKGDAENRRLRIGLIAEDAPEEMTSEDGKAMSLSDSIGFLLAAVKAQQEHVRALEEEINVLKIQLQSR